MLVAVLLTSCLALIFVGTASAQTYVTSPNAQSMGYFGWSVAVSDNTVVVGAPGETAGGYSGAGNVYVLLVSQTTTTSTTPSSTPTSSTTTTTSTAIPEFPVQLVASLLVTVAIVTSYSVVRRVKTPRL